MTTKQDLTILKTDLLNAIDAKASQFEIKTNNLENKIQQLEYRITIKLGSLLIAGFTTMATLMKIWLSH